MKTKDLITKLHEADPSGELEVSVENIDIHSVETLPCYYNGCQQKLIYDENLKPYYSIIGGKYLGKDTKVVITLVTFEDAILCDEDFSIDYSEVPDSMKSHYQKLNDEFRLEVKNVNIRQDKDLFIEYVQDKLDLKFKNDYKTHNLIEKFYDENLNYKDQMPQEIESLSEPSWNDKRKMQWDQELIVELISNEIVVSKRN